MDFEKYTERSKGFVQAAQTLALRRNHQQLMPLHLLSVLLEDKEGLAANLIRAAGGDPERARSRCDAELAKLPKVEGGSGQVYMAPETARLFEQAEQIAEKAGDQFVTAERLLLQWLGPNRGPTGDQMLARIQGVDRARLRLYERISAAPVIWPDDFAISASFCRNAGP